MQRGRETFGPASGNDFRARGFRRWGPRKTRNLANGLLVGDGGLGINFENGRVTINNGKSTCLPFTAQTRKPANLGNDVNYCINKVISTKERRSVGAPHHVPRKIENAAPISNFERQ